MRKLALTFILLSVFGLASLSIPHQTSASAADDAWCAANTGCGTIRNSFLGLFGYYCRVGGMRCDVTNAGGWVAQSCSGIYETGRTCCVGPNATSATAQCLGAIPPSPTPLPTTDPAYNPYAAPRKAFFDSVDPLQVGGGDTIQTEERSVYANALRSPGGVVSRLLVFIFPLAGLILFFMLVWGGFEMLIGAPTKKSMESGRNRVTAAIVGFLLLFSSYWIWQIIEVVFGVKIL